MDKITGQQCPRCGLLVLNVYYDDDTDLELGACCDECGYNGLYIRGKLVQVTTV